MRPAKTLAFLVALALVLAALPTQAMASEFEAESYPVEVLGENKGNHTIGVEDKLSVECSIATFEGKIDLWAETEEVTPTYSGCTAFGFSATVNTNGCSYLLHAGEELSEPGDFEGTMDVICPTGQKIVITAATCELQIWSQENLSALQYHNNTEASPDDITMLATLTKLKYSKTKDGIGCPLTGTGESEVGTYGGTWTVWAEEEDAGGAKAKKGFAVVKPPNTKLCKKQPIPNCGEFYTANTQIEGKRPAGGPSFNFALKEVDALKAPSKNVISCAESKFETKTEAEAGVPLQEIVLTFTKDCTTTSGKSCTIQMENSTPKGFIRWSRLVAPFGGHLTVNTVDLHLECKGELKCEYVAAPISMEFFGSANSTLGVGEWLNRVPTAGEENCWQYAYLGGTWELSPASIWLLKV